MNRSFVSWTITFLSLVGLVQVSQGEDTAKMANPTRVVADEQGYRVELDLSKQVLLLSVPEDPEEPGGAGSIQEGRSPDLGGAPG